MDAQDVEKVFLYYLFVHPVSCENKVDPDLAAGGAITLDGFQPYVF